MGSKETIGKRTKRDKHMKLTNRESWCLIILTALQMGYTSIFDEETILSYLKGIKPIPAPYISELNKEAYRLQSEVSRDGRIVEANQKVQTILY